MTRLSAAVTARSGGLGDAARQADARNV